MCFLSRSESRWVNNYTQPHQPQQSFHDQLQISVSYKLDCNHKMSLSMSLPFSCQHISLNTKTDGDDASTSSRIQFGQQNIKYHVIPAMNDIIFAWKSVLLHLYHQIKEWEIENGFVWLHTVEEITACRIFKFWLFDAYNMQSIRRGDPVSSL